MKVLRTLRGKFGIAAPKLTVRTHIPWYWRSLSVAVVAVAFAVLAWAAYDIGGKFAGFDRGQAEREIAALRDANSQLQQENAALHRESARIERQLEIERVTRDDLAAQIKSLSEGNALLKEDLAFFQTLMPAGGRDGGISINRLKVERDALPGEYRYRLLLLKSGKQAEFRGSLQFVLNLQQDGRKAVTVLPAEGDNPDAFRLRFRFYQRLEGGFKVAPDAEVKSVQVRVLEDGAAEPKAAQSLNLS